MCSLESRSPLAPWGHHEPSREADIRAEPGLGEELLVPPCCPLGHSPAQQLSSDWGSEEGIPASCGSVLSLSRSSQGTVTERQPEGRVLGNPDCTTVAG